MPLTNKVLYEQFGGDLCAYDHQQVSLQTASRRRSVYRTTGPVAIWCYYHQTFTDSADEIST